MCGIVAVVGETDSVDLEGLVAMRDAMRHRGPDECGDWVSDDRSIGLAHRRLCIVDLVHGQQPMEDDRGDVVLVYNGELYNHRELRSELETLGRRFQSRCDTEVLANAYAEWGADCLHRLDGMFAFAVWDRRRRSLFLARDRMGKKPLYFARTRTGYAFASEIKALLRHSDVTRAVDVDSLPLYLSFLVVPAPKTMFAGIGKLPAGHCATWTRGETLEVRRWWTPASSNGGVPTESEIAATVRQLLLAAVEKRMMGDVPFGVYLSGGIDSTANVALMSELMTEPVKTFSVAFDGDADFDERVAARGVSRHFGTNHRELVLTDEDVVDLLPDMVHHQDEPLGDPVCIPLLALARETKAAGVTVIQIGEGSDEVFFGYSVYADVLARAAQLRRVQRVVPRLLLLGALRLSRPLVGSLQYEFARDAIKRGVLPAHAFAGLSERDKQGLGALNGGPGAYDFLHEEFGSGREPSDIVRVTWQHEFGLRLPELLLMRVDKMTMAASVEGRAPYLDRDLVDFALRLPLEAHWRNGHGKRALRSALVGLVPPDVLTRPKRGFGAPVTRWTDKLRREIEAELLRPQLDAHFDREAMRRLLARPVNSRVAFELWVLLTFALWHRHWIEGVDLREVGIGRSQ